MKIQAADLKALLRKVSSSKAETLVLDAKRGLLIVSDPEITIFAADPKLIDGWVGATSLRKFSSVVNRMSGEIDLTFTDKFLLQSAKARIELESMAYTLPVFPKPEEHIDLPLTEFKDLISYAASAAEVNKASMFGGVIQIISRTEGIESLAPTPYEVRGTDGGKMAWAKSKDAAPAAFDMLLPLPAIAPIQSLTGEKIKIGRTPSVYIFEQDKSVVIYAKRLTRTYPDLMKNMPKSFKFEATISAPELRNALRVIEPMLNQNCKNAVSVHFVDTTLCLKTVGAKAEDSIQYEQISPDPMLSAPTDLKINLQHDWLFRFVNQIEGDFRLHANSPKEPVLVRSGDKSMFFAAMVDEAKGPVA